MSKGSPFMLENCPGELSKKLLIDHGEEVPCTCPVAAKNHFIIKAFTARNEHFGPSNACWCFAIWWVFLWCENFSGPGTLVYLDCLAQAWPECPDWRRKPGPDLKGEMPRWHYCVTWLGFLLNSSPFRKARPPIVRWGRSSYKLSPSTSPWNEVNFTVKLY